MAFPKQLLISYVEGLKLAPFDKAVSTGATNALDEDTASVVGSLAVGFPEGLDTQLKADIQNSMLFAQFAASAKYNKTDQAYEWYKFSKEVVENIGWKILAFGWNEVQDVIRCGSVDKLVLELAAAQLAQAQFKLLKCIIEALPKAVNAGAQKIFDDSSINNNKANFQVAIAGASDGNAVLKLGGHFYSVQSKIVHALFTKFDGQPVKFMSSWQSMALDDQVYSTVRQVIIDKLGQAADLVADIKLSPTVD